MKSLFGSPVPATKLSTLRRMFVTYAAACVFFVHGVIADPEVKNRPIDFLDAEKVYVEACALVVIAAIVWRVRHRRAVRLAARVNSAMQQLPTPK